MFRQRADTTARGSAVATGDFPDPTRGGGSASGKLTEAPGRPGWALKGYSNRPATSGFGGKPLNELYVMCGAARRSLDKRGVGVVRSLAGNFVTSLAMVGCSVTVCLLDSELIDLWDRPVHTAALRW